MTYDLFVIGGGVNGCGIARDATGRGLTVYLAEQNDLASGTSSASTKLIHGGLRYLEHYEFRLVREALIEREILLNAAPHIIWPLRFILPHHRAMRAWPILRTGLFLYDHLGGRKLLPGTSAVDLAHDPRGQPLRTDFTRGYEYSDCWVDDARLVVLNAKDAAARGAVIATRSKVTAARRDGGEWLVTVSGAGGEETVRAKALVNAAGPWVAEVLNGVVAGAAPGRIRQVKGSHLVVDRLYDHDRCYIFQNADGRICFTIPYEQAFTLIGTTDLDHRGDPAGPHISEAETDYLLSAVSEYLKKPVTRAQVKWSYSGIRPLYDDGASKAQEATRDYVLRLEGGAGEAPLLSVFGGKITTYRKLAEAALVKLGPSFPAMAAPWTASAKLPGGDIAFAEIDTFIADAQRRYSFFAPATVRRMARAYGTAIDKVFDGARFAADMGPAFGQLTAREIDYLRREEWAQTAADVLWRRSKLGLHLSSAEQDAVHAYVEASAA